jgi:hypothetical protein
MAGGSCRTWSGTMNIIITAFERSPGGGKGAGARSMAAA